MQTKTNFAERHIKALKLAKKCAEHGARLRTVAYVTGLPHSQLNQLFFPDRQLAQRGRPPDSPEWYHGTNLLNRTEASIVTSIYRRIRELGFGPAEALVSGYQHYLGVCNNPARISFDRAFDLASHLDGLWIVLTPSFSLATCPVCKCQYVTAVGVLPATNCECPFCKLVSRYRRDPRIQISFPLSPLPDMKAMQSSLLVLSPYMTGN